MRQRFTAVPPHDKPPYGDCWATAIAMLCGQSAEWRNELHARIEEADPKANSGDPDWWNITNTAVADLGIPNVIGITSITQDELDAQDFRGPRILSGQSPRGDLLHSILVEADGTIRDPHPSDAGIGDLVDIVCLWSGPE